MKTISETHLCLPGIGYRRQSVSVAHDTATVPPARPASGMAGRAFFLPVRPTAKFLASEIPASVSAVIVGGLARLFFRPMNRRGRRLHRWLALNRSVIEL